MSFKTTVLTLWVRVFYRNRYKQQQLRYRLINDYTERIEKIGQEVRNGLIDHAYALSDYERCIKRINKYTYDYNEHKFWFQEPLQEYKEIYELQK